MSYETHRVLAKLSFNHSEAAKRYQASCPTFTEALLNVINQLKEIMPDAKGRLETTDNVLNCLIIATDTSSLKTLLPHIHELKAKIEKDKENEAVDGWELLYLCKLCSVCYYLGDDSPIKDFAAMFRDGTIIKRVADLDNMLNSDDHQLNANNFLDFIINFLGLFVYCR